MGLGALWERGRGRASRRGPGEAGGGGPGPVRSKRTGEELRRQGDGQPGPLGVRRKGWGPLGLEVGRRGCPGHVSRPRLLHLPRTPRRPRRSSWPTRWRPEWRPGTTASLPSGTGARSVCSRLGPGAGPALSVVGPSGPPPAPHRRASPSAAPRTRASAQAEARPATHDATRRRRHRAPVPCLVGKSVRAGAREAADPAVAEVEGGSGKDD